MELCNFSWARFTY